jgi:hypothetical protein
MALLGWEGLSEKRDDRKTILPLRTEALLFFQ